MDWREEKERLFELSIEERREVERGKNTLFLNNNDIVGVPLW